jgi:hypothetical protein
VGTLGKNGSRANVGMADCWLIYKKITNLEWKGSSYILVFRFAVLSDAPYFYGSILLRLFTSTALYFYGSILLRLYNSTALYFYGSILQRLYTSTALYLYGSITMALYFYGSILLRLYRWILPLAPLLRFAGRTLRKRIKSKCKNVPLSIVGWLTKKITNLKEKALLTFQCSDLLSCQVRNGLSNIVFNSKFITKFRSNKIFNNKVYRLYGTNII